MEELDAAKIVYQSELFDAIWYAETYNLTNEDLLLSLSSELIAEFNVTISNLDHFKDEWQQDDKAYNIWKLVVIFHYLRYGWKQGLDPSENFSTSEYIGAYSDVKSANVNPLLHYIQYGVNEGRLYSKHRKDASFSIILPTYNRKGMVCKAIDSILNQDQKIEYELIIVDDGSEDGTVSFLTEKYKNEILLNKIRIVKASHGGVCKARNLGVKNATYDWICYADDDNVLKENYLNCFLKEIRKDALSELFYGQHHLTKSNKVSEHAFDMFSLLKENYIDLGVICHSKRLFDLCGGFDESLTRLVDWDLIIRLASKTRPTYIPSILLEYSDIQDYERISNSVSIFQNIKKIQEKHLYQVYMYECINSVDSKYANIFDLQQVDISSIKKLVIENEKDIKDKIAVLDDVSNKLKTNCSFYEVQLAQHAEQLAQHAEQLAQHAEQLAQHAEQLAQHAEQLAQHTEQLTQHDRRILELEEIVANSLSRFLILKFKFLKSITFGKLHQKYKQIYKKLTNFRKRRYSYR